MMNLLISRKLVTKKKLSEIDKEVMTEIEQAVAFAMESLPPEVEQLHEDLYV